MKLYDIIEQIIQRTIIYLKENMLKFSNCGKRVMNKEQVRTLTALNKF